ncbi:DyP-type peroxidase [Pleomassaria siparia CBS 279.74]|uniref:DyP-type peroxidase n=1 Tax=Pleomassaria siparia CBS 279.74 TaxID=1314801 RepID=A0A6G1K4E0_9PLEO|nr:DyP-type peroxidase [Pleomassaria siparia CBS 279.74]
MAVAPLSLANVQGDILFGLPKQTQSFFLFQIDEVDGFRSNLLNLVPLITSAEQTKGNITEIRRFKELNGLKVNEGDGETVHPDVITVSGVNIAFSAKGLAKIGIVDDIKDPAFSNGMKNDAAVLGDNGVFGDDGFVPDWDAAFLEEIHGVALIAGDSHESVDEKLANVKDILKTTVKEISTLSGDVRPGDERGREHFGYQDGISNPSVEGVDAINPGQTVINQGVALLGRGFDLNFSRPDWALDGSFMALRKLPQLVPEFDKFLLDTAGTQEGADLMGARMVGRWKSGAPIIKSPTQDDPALGADAARNNDFKFTANDQSKCPFAAHIRKMNPRNDLDEEDIRPHMVLRRGIPFGPEVSDAERASNTTQQERGLLFVCYQSVIKNGFSFLQQSWANSQGFPFPIGDVPGFDPIIGQQTGGGVRQMTGAFASNTSQPINLVAQWVNAKGGEYFFSPSIPTLRDVFAKAT